MKVWRRPDEMGDNRAQSKPWKTKAVVVESKVPETLNDRVRRVVADVLGLEVGLVAQTTSHEQVEGWDSLAVVHLSMALEEEFSVRFSPEEAISFLSVESIEAVLKEKTVR